MGSGHGYTLNSDEPRKFVSAAASLRRVEITSLKETVLSSSKKSALVTGVTGQDGGHLAALLHDQGYEVFGLIRGQNNSRKGPLLLSLIHI